MPRLASNDPPRPTAAICADAGSRPTHPRKRGYQAATRFDKLAVRYEVTVRVASINVWLRNDI
jgi:hypothetical protein